MRYDLTFFLCCCKSFLGSDKKDDGEDFYSLLGVDRDAGQDDIKRAYKRQSLQMHPDKLAQRGLTVTAADQAKFTRMKEAYEVLSDPHKRETYDAVGERGMKWIEEPFSIDPQELAHNFATSSAVDRSKIFAIFVAAVVAVFLLPVLVCMHVDGDFGPDASWLATLTPLWLWDAFLLFYHTRVIMMGPIAKPDHIPAEEWVDPLPMKKRIFSMVRFALIVVFEVLVAIKLDGMLGAPWILIFFPLYIWEVTTLYKKWPLARMRIVTVEDLETALGKPFRDFTTAEKELIGKRYSVVSSTQSPEFEAAQKLKARARHDIIKSIFRIVFVMVLLFQLDGGSQWNWWVVFAPFWIMTILICFANYQAFVEVQLDAMEKAPSLFGEVPPTGPTGDAETGEAGKESTHNLHESTTGYGAVGTDGAATAAQASKPPLTEEEKEELKATLMASSSRLCSKCCTQGFLLFIVILFVAKLEGAGFSSFWIISPFLFVAGIILCCLGCAIFGITEVPTEGVDFDVSDFGYMNAGGYTGTAADPYVPPPPPATGTASDVKMGQPPQPQQATVGEGSQNVSSTSIPTTGEPIGQSQAQSNPTPPQKTEAKFDLLDDKQKEEDVPKRPSYDLD